MTEQNNLKPIEGSQKGFRSLVDWAGENRVTLAIVFTDIVGSTALGVELGDERMNEVRIAHFKHSEALLAKYLGRQVKTIGDSVMAVFRSVGSALDYACAMHLDPGAAELRLHGLRAGIHNGEVHVVESDVFGTEVAFAARVVQAIEGAEVWLSARAREAIDRAGARHQRNLRWHQHDDVELKGFGKYPLWSLNVDSAARPIELTASNPVAAALRPQPEPPVRTRLPASNGRTIFVAQPADDMGQAYVRVLDELKNRGFTVVPNGDIPKEDGAVEFIETAAAASELSIHLLGEKRGYAPAEEDPIVRLQLSCAARRVQAGETEKPSGATGFRRIIWAPRFLDGPNSIERDPLAVLERFSAQLPSDKVLGENPIKFIEFLHDYLDKTRPRTAAVAAKVASGAKIFIDHGMDDFDYATELAVALAELSFDPRLAILDGKPSQVNAQNRREMLDCAAVALCWGNATEAWVRAEASKLDQWRRQGRRDELEATLLAAPPSHRLKERWLRIRLPGIDHVVNMTAVDRPSPADLAKWVGLHSDHVGVTGDD